MKKLFLATLALVVLISSTALASVKITLDGAPVSSDVSPTIINGWTMVPFRTIFEALGASVEWNPASQTVTAKKDSTVINLTIGVNTVKVNGVESTLDIAPQIIDGRTMVPVRAVSTNMGYDVVWDDSSKTVKISTGANEEPWKSTKISFGELATELEYIANGWVEYRNGEYWTTPSCPDFEENLVYSVDISSGNTTQQWNSGTTDLSELKWMTANSTFQKISFRESQLPFSVEGLEKNKYDEYEVYCFIRYSLSGYDKESAYFMNEITEEFLNSQNASGTFNGVQAKKENGILTFYIPDMEKIGYDK